jgi:CheY-like chemotaxis protein
MKKIGALPPAPRRDPKARPILYVEDNDDNWRVAELRLGAKFALARAHGDEEACKLLRSAGDQFVAILMDIELQGSVLNGIDLTRLIRGRPLSVAVPAFAVGMPRFDMPVIFMTAYGEIHAESTLRAAGGDSLMTKPIDFKQLNMALMNLYVNRTPA